MTNESTTDFPDEDDDATSEREAGYIEGSRLAWLSMLQSCLTNLGYKNPESDKVAWIKEREDAAHQLAELCASVGIDFDEDLYMADTIENVRDFFSGPDEPDNSITELLARAHEVFPSEKARHSITLNSETGRLELTIMANDKWNLFILDDEAELGKGAALISEIQALMAETIGGSECEITAMFRNWDTLDDETKNAMKHLLPPRF